MLPEDRIATLRELDRLDCEESLLCFVRRMWSVVEPAANLVEGEPLTAICHHLEAVTDGLTRRLLINVPPGSMKSLLVSVFWPAWEWTTRPWLRYVCFAYAANLTERDNRKFLAVVRSQEYRELWPEVELTKTGQTQIENTHTGVKLATSVTGVGTGVRGDRVILDDPHSVLEAESDAVRSSTIEWFQNAMSNRLNNASESAIVIIMQRVHEEDVSGFVIEKNLGYTHLMIPAEFDPGRSVANDIGWKDWRTVEGESFWPDRFPDTELEMFRRTLTPSAYAGQYQQTPEPKGGGILKRDWWMPWMSKSFPQFSYIIGSLDTAYTEKEENDFSALTVWGVFNLDPGANSYSTLLGAYAADADGDVEKRAPLTAIRPGKPATGALASAQAIGADGLGPRAMLMYAWHGRVAIHELVKESARICRDYRVSRLLIEGKASGISVSQELRRLYQFENWSVQMVDPGRQDKQARAQAIANLFWEELVYAPFDETGQLPRKWAGMVIDECAVFPRGKHDDLVDSTTQALNHFRETGVLVRQPEYMVEVEERRRYRKPVGQLYPV